MIFRKTFGSSQQGRIKPGRDCGGYISFGGCAGDISWNSYRISLRTSGGRKEYRFVFYKGIAFGAALYVISCVPIVIAGVAKAADGIILGLCAFLLAIVSLGVYMIVRVSIRKGGYDRLLQQGKYTEEKSGKTGVLRPFPVPIGGLLPQFILQ